MMTRAQADLLKEGDRMYARFVKPLEHEHRGEYVAVAADGTVVLAATLPDLLEKAEQTLPSGSFLFMVGDIAVDVWR